MSRSLHVFGRHGRLHVRVGAPARRRRRAAAATRERERARQLENLLGECTHVRCCLLAFYLQGARAAQLQHGALVVESTLLLGAAPIRSAARAPAAEIDEFAFFSRVTDVQRRAPRAPRRTHAPRREHRTHRSPPRPPTRAPRAPRPHARTHREHCTHRSPPRPLRLDLVERDAAAAAVRRLLPEGAGRLGCRHAVPDVEVAHGLAVCASLDGAEDEDAVPPHRVRLALARARLAELLLEQRLREQRGRQARARARVRSAR